MKEIVHFSTPEFLQQGEFITSPFISPKSRIISARSIVDKVVAELPEHAEQQQLRETLFKRYSQERGTVAMTEFFLFENLEFDSQKYAHSSLAGSAHTLWTSITNVISSVTTRIETFLQGDSNSGFATY